MRFSIHFVAVDRESHFHPRTNRQRRIIEKLSKVAAGRTSHFHPRGANSSAVGTRQLNGGAGTIQVFLKTEIIG